MFSVKLGIGLALASLPLLGLAQAPGGAGPCRADLQTYCAKASGGPRTLECLIDHQKEISDGCYDALKARLAQQRGNDACKADVHQFCRNVKPGEGRIMDCLVDHQKEISDSCYESLKAQKTGAGGPGNGPSASSAPSAPSPIYRTKQADGRTVYSDTLPMNGTPQRQVPQDRANVAPPQ